MEGDSFLFHPNAPPHNAVIPPQVPFTSLPISLNLTNVVSVSAGLRHTAVATRDGRAYTWGHGHRGQLGHIDGDGQLVKQQPTPRVVDHVEGVVSEGREGHLRQQ